MPSEVPRMPGQTHKSMLNHGASKGLGLQAGEVAWYPNRNDADQRAKRYAKRVAIALMSVLVISTFIGIRASM